jgi:Holliday junction resolvasome RuvABC endonuclease subunit
MAIDPGLNAVGIAILDPGGRLRDATVFTTPAHQALTVRLRTIGRRVRELLRLHRPGVLVLEKTWKSRNQAHDSVHRVALLVARLTRSRGLPVKEIHTFTVRRRVVGFGKAGKRDVAAVISSIYPELRVYRGQSRAWKERYFGNLFDAVALGVCYQQERRDTKKRLLRTPRHRNR